MKRVLSSCLLIICSLMCPEVIAQKVDPESVCFYSCTDVATTVLETCAPTTLADHSKIEDDLNPYLIFDALLRTIVAEAGSKRYNLKFTFKTCEVVCNAAAARGMDAEQFIFYNPEFIKDIRLTGNEKRWALLGIFAHEIGHQIMDHTKGDEVGLKMRRSQELRADYFGGYLLSKFPGATVENALACLKTLDPETYHPATDLEEGIYGYRYCRNGIRLFRKGLNKKSRVLWESRCLLKSGSMQLKMTSG